MQSRKLGHRLDFRFHMTGLKGLALISDTLAPELRSFRTRAKPFLSLTKSFRYPSSPRRRLTRCHCRPKCYASSVNERTSLSTRSVRILRSRQCARWGLTACRYRSRWKVWRNKTSNTTERLCLPQTSKRRLIRHECSFSAQDPRDAARG